MAQAYAVAGITPQPRTTQNTGTNVDDLRKVVNLLNVKKQEL